MAGKPVHVADDQFETIVLRSDKPVLVDFWAPWCGPCLMVASVLDKLAGEYEGRMIIAKVNTDENPKWANEYGVQGIPTLLVFFNGELIKENMGALPEPYLRDLIESALEISDAILPH